MSFRQTNGNKSPIIYDCHILLGSIVLKIFVCYYCYLILIHQYNSNSLAYLHCSKNIGGNIFHMRKRLNLKLLLINIYAVFFLPIPFLTLFYYKNLQLYCLHMF